MEITVGMYGGAGTVTGSNFLLSDGTTNILIDCGLTQGKDFCDACNYDAFEYDVKEVTAVIFTHAHLDHIGRGPKLVKDGFNGSVYTTPPTEDLMAVMLEDSEGILKREADRMGRPPMYEKEHVHSLLSKIVTKDYHQKFEIGDFTCEFFDAGHILGSAIVKFTHKKTNKSYVFTGDLGNSPSPLLPDTEFVTDANYLIMESVYGDRLHEDIEHREEKLRDIIKRSVERGGVLMIPAFSMERTQILLYNLSNMMEAGEIPKVPVFLDSPLAIKVTSIYRKYSKYLKRDLQGEIQKEGDIFDFPFLTKTETREESKSIDHHENPKIIIAGAGMSHGGRIQHHELHHLDDPKSTLMIVGYQSAGSIGRLLQDGAKSVRIMDKDVKVKATIETLSGYSAHADRDNLVELVSHTSTTLDTVFVAMGEPGPASFLAQRLHDFLDVKTVLPERGRVYTLT
ncbi:MAG: MBL fold metallo-hydrolase [Patescibacteria group bacterium UBA2103]